MKNVISFFQTLLLRQVFTIFLVTFTFIAAPVFSNSMLVANAETVLSPEGVYYKGTPDGSLRKSDENNNKSVFDASEATKNNPQNRVDERRGNSLGENIVSPEEATKNNSQNRVQEKSENPIQEAIETVREKLNLDEDLPRSTKEFLKETEETVEETVEPITGTRKGYYQIP
jgi:hypothetical protein